MAVEVETEFGFYGGDCAWAALHMALHKLNPGTWPLTLDVLNAITRAAIATNIGVGPQGQATPEQVWHLCQTWGISFTILQPSGAPVTRAQLITYLDDNVSAPTNRPVIIHFTNGGALYTPATGLQGHAIVALHPYDGANSGYVCGDGNNPLCAHGFPAYYNADVLLAAQPYAMYVLDNAPAVPGISISPPPNLSAVATLLRQALSELGG